MEKRMAYSSQIDIESYKNIRFVLRSLDDKEKDIEISADYGPAHDEPGMITADVWARFADGALRRFLYTADIPMEKCGLEDYAGVALEIYRSPQFLAALKEFAQWAYNGPA